MKKSRFDSRTVSQLVNDLISERSELGQTIEILYDYNIPSIKLRFPISAEPEDISTWLPASPIVYKNIDSVTGQPLKGEIPVYENWKGYIGALLSELSGIIRASGRKFVSTEEIVKKEEINVRS